MKKNISISIMFPCYNDKGTILQLIDNAEKTISKYTDNYEIIIVDDFSTDGSREILKKEMEKRKSLRVLFHKKNMGYGRTITDGLKFANKEFFFYTDGDGQYDVKDIAKLLGIMEGNELLINGYKIFRMDPLYRVIIGKMYNTFMRFFFGIKIKDIDCDFRIIRRDIFKNETFFSQSGTICIELVKKIQLKNGIIKQAPVNHFNREYGTSQFFNFKRLFKVFIHLIILWYLLIGKRI